MVRLALIMAVAWLGLLASPSAQTTIANPPKEFAQHYKAYQSLIAADKHGDAIPHAEAALKIAQGSDKFDDPTRAQLAYNLAQLYLMNGEYTKAIDMFSMVLDYDRKAHGKDTLESAEILVYRAICHTRMYEDRKAEADLNRAMPLLDGPQPSVQALRADALESLAWIRLRQKRAGDGLELATEAHAISEKLFGPYNPRTLNKVLAKVAAMYVRGVKYKALDLLAQTLSHVEQATKTLMADTGRTDAKCCTRRQLVSFYHYVSELYHVMERKSDEKYYGDLSSEIAKGLPPRESRVKPIKRDPPTYPRIATRRAQNGWVILEFTVRADGTTSDIRVVDAAPKGMFERTSVVAAEHWKYEPPMDDGQPTEIKGVRTCIMFKMEY